MSTELIFNFDYEVLANTSADFDLNFKIIVLGDSGVGKSCLTNRAIRDNFQENFSPTIGFEFFTFIVKIEDKIIKLQIWDTCGQEMYCSLISNFYHNSSLAFIVYSVADKESFKNVEVWYNEIREKSNPDVKIFLVGNKIDLDESREVQKEEGQNFADFYNFNKFVETSAKSGFNAQNIFIEAAKVLYDEYLKYQKDKENEDDNEITINIKNEPKRKKGRCCK